MGTKRIVAGAAIALALSAALVLSRPATGADDEVAGVTASCQAFKAGWNSHDAKAIAAVFAEDGDHIDPFGKLDTGRPAIEAMLTEAMGPKGPFRDSSLVVEKETVRFPTADTAVTDAEATVSGVYGPDGSKQPTMAMHVTNVWRKTNGKWLVFACRPYAKPAAPAH